MEYSLIRERVFQGRSVCLEKYVFESKEELMKRELFQEHKNKGMQVGIINVNPMKGDIRVGKRDNENKISCQIKHVSKHQNEDILI